MIVSASVLFSACADPSSPPGEPSVEFRTDLDSYVSGAMISTELTNRGSSPIEIRGDCGPFFVERETEGAWERVPIFCVGPPFTARIEGGGTFAHEYSTAHVMAEPGVYRFTVRVAWVGDESTHEAATPPFVIQE